jgi:hypothetical protein
MSTLDFGPVLPLQAHGGEFANFIVRPHTNNKVANCVLNKTIQIKKLDCKSYVTQDGVDK